jgi:hypothetical protein
MGEGGGGSAACSRARQGGASSRGGSWTGRDEGVERATSTRYRVYGRTRGTLAWLGQVLRVASHVVKAEKTPGEEQQTVVDRAGRADLSGDIFLLLLLQRNSTADGTWDWALSIFGDERLCIETLALSVAADQNRRAPGGTLWGNPLANHIFEGPPSARAAPDRLLIRRNSTYCVGFPGFQWPAVRHRRCAYDMYV